MVLIGLEQVEGLQNTLKILLISLSLFLANHKLCVAETGCHVTIWPLGPLQGKPRMGSLYLEGAY